MNKCLFTGRLTREPAYKAKGLDKTSIIAFTIAVNNSFGDNEKTLFLDCTAYGVLADRLNEVLYKGVKVIVEGVLYTYDSQYGNNKLALTLKDCEIVQHTNAYLNKNANVIRDLDNRVKEVLTEAEKYAPPVASQNVINKSNTIKSSKSKMVDWGEIEKELMKNSKPNLLEDEDGFIICNDDEEGLPFD